MQLLKYVDRYALENDITRDSVDQLRIRARLLTTFAGGALQLADLSAELVNRWLVSRQAQGRSPDTVAADRTKILTLWNSAAETGLCQSPGKIRRIKRIHKLPRALQHEAIERLLAVAGTLKGTIRHRDKSTGRFYDTGVKRSLYWHSWIQAAYDSGLRRGNQLLIERNWIMPFDGGGILGILQPKTKRSIVVRFRPSTMQAIDALCGGRTTGPIWGDYGSRRVWCQAFKRLCRRAGIEGTAKWLRRSGASYLAREQGKDAAKRFLGHATDGVADASYIDPMIAYPAPLLPPPVSAATTPATFPAGTPGPPSPACS
jgi:integrase